MRQTRLVVAIGGTLAGLALIVTVAMTAGEPTAARFDQDAVARGMAVTIQPAATKTPPRPTRGTPPPKTPRQPTAVPHPGRPTPVPQTPAECPVGVAHRGAPTEAPENTLPALQLAYAAGAPMVEIDVQWTSDTVPVALHDSSLDRTTNGTGTVPSKTWAQLAGLKANDFAPWNTDPRYANTGIPRIATLLDAVPAGREILLDIHNPNPTQAQTAALHGLLSARGMLERAIVQADPAILAAMDGWFPALRTRAIENPAANVIRPGWWVASYGDGYVVPAGRIDSFPVVNYWHQYGLTVWVWAPNTATDWNRLRDAGVDGMITDEIRDYMQWCAS